MLAFLAPLLGPIFKGAFASAVEGYKAKLDAGNTQERIAADLATKELEVQQREVEAKNALRIAQVGHPFEPEKLFAYILVLYFAKLVLWDKVIGSFAGYTENVFRTDALSGEAVGWAAMVMTFYFGKRGIENVARIIRR